MACGGVREALAWGMGTVGGSPISLCVKQVTSSGAELFMCMPGLHRSSPVHKGPQTKGKLGGALAPCRHGRCHNKR